MEKEEAPQTQEEPPAPEVEKSAEEQEEEAPMIDIEEPEAEAEKEAEEPPPKEDTGDLLVSSTYFQHSRLWNFS